MGAFAGAAQVISDRMHQQHLMDWEANRQANQSIAGEFRRLASDPNTLPEYVPIFEQEYFKAMMTPPGKKYPGNLANLVKEHEQAKITQNKAAVLSGQSAPHTVNPQALQGITPPPGSLPQPSGGQGLDQFSGQAPDASGAAPAQAPQPMQAPPNPAAAVALAIASQQTAAQAPPAVSGLPSPGFAGAPAPPPDIAAQLGLGQPSAVLAQHELGAFPDSQGYRMSPMQSNWLAQYGKLIDLFGGAKGKIMSEQAQEEAKHASTMKYGKEALDLSSKIGVKPTPQQMLEVMTGLKLGKSFQNVPGLGLVDLSEGKLVIPEPKIIPAGAGIGLPSSEGGMDILREPQSPAVSGDIVPHPGTSTGYARVLRDRFGNTMGFEQSPEGGIAPALPPPAMIPQATSHIQEFQTPAGAEYRPVTSVRAPVIPGGKGAGSSVGAPIAGVGGLRPLTVQQRMAAEKSLGAVDNTIQLAERVKGNLDLLSNLVDAKKIEFQVDPTQGIVKAIINRSVPLTEREANFAGDIQSLMEHINTLRGPLGATGFRGHEAWGALQAQRGSLTANPEVTKRTLENTLAALKTQKSAYDNALGNKNSITPPPGQEVPANVRRALSSVGPGKHTLSDNSVWIKKSDGTIERQ